MKQTPAPEDFLLKWRGDKLVVTLELDSPRKGRAAFRTNITHARVRRREIIAETERGETPMARAWSDIPLNEVAPGKFSAEILLDEVGLFSGKACFFPEGSNVPEWPDGSNTHIKVESAQTRKNNSIYTIFPRQFGSFREVVRRLPIIMDSMGFRIIQTLPPFPVPTTYAVMGEYGCPFAALDFLSVDPAMAEFDERATPLDQFKEMIDAVHSRNGLFFVDLPANHTGWASTLQTHHPDWFHRENDGKFVSPGAWGVKWADLVELDYRNSELCAYMAEVFLFWCRIGVDGFRCDAGYMIPFKTWEYIVAKVREEYPDTVFMLEGLGGDIKLTDNLLAQANLDWAYSEVFQTYDRGGFEWYLPGAIKRSERYGTLVHFAETHDNDRLAKGGEVYARLRVQLAALLSWQGAWGIANGVEWYAREKIDVHGKNDLSWGAQNNMLELIAHLNRILDGHTAFAGASKLEVITQGDGNTLAVVRNQGGKDATLVLANLDCGKDTTIAWDLTKFPIGEVYDLLNGGKLELLEKVRLAPGEVRCVSLCETMPFGEANKVDCEVNALCHWSYPRDINRVFAVPEGQMVEISAPHHFRMRLVDPATGRTIRVRTSKGHFAHFDTPHYKGDGSKCRELYLEMAVYAPGKAMRVRSKFLITPRPRLAKAKLTMTGEEVRRHPEYRTILSNGAGAASQVRVGWGEICSQYDAFLAANPNPSVPSDRLNLWARTRCWLQREGYLREFDKQCVTKFVADPAGREARWQFAVPCGMGKETAFVFTLAFAPLTNAVRLKIVREEASENDVGDRVRLVFRPDIEWRSFHATTKAYQGIDVLFAKSVKTTESKFTFKPYDKEFNLHVQGGVCHHEPQWMYNVPHAEEAERGQDGAGDLFSPGWISADLSVGESMEIVGSYDHAPIDKFVPSEFNLRPLNFKAALTAALDLYIVKRDNLKTVIAGYPWFLDWGRDTFIFMRGMIASGRYTDSLKILKAFAAFEERGTLPNIIYGETAGNRDTTDAPLWFIRCVEELENAAPSLAKAEFKALKTTCQSIVDNYLKGTPNGIKVDSESALVWSPSHFTWMDTNYPACTPRVGYPVEIQALWISALRYLKREELVERALNSVMRLMKRPDGNGYYDTLAAPSGESASLAKPEMTIRPNQLFLITLGILNDKSIIKATEELLIPGGIRSLEAGNALYRGRYTGDEDTSRKPAYHNGTVWAWQFPLYAEAMYLTKSCSREVALSLLAGAVENFNSGTVGHVSENADGDAPHAQKGCTAQAWSDSELLRVWLKLGGK